jgi:molybdopterin synthase sulfur carrier subunit
MITIKLFATLRDIAGGVKTIQVPLGGTYTARDLALAVREMNPDLGAKLLTDQNQLTGQVHILVNGRNIEWLDGLDTRIAEGDTLALIPPVAGG